MLEGLWDVVQGMWQQLQMLLALGQELDTVGPLPMALRALVIYTVALLMVRIANKRFLSQASAFDVVVAILLGSILSRAINGSAPFLPTVAAGAAVLGLHWVFAYLAYTTSFFGGVVKGSPRLLVEDGRLKEDQLRKATISKQDIEQALRLQTGEVDLSRVKRMYLERNGRISVIPTDTEPRILEVSVEDGVKTIRIRLE